MAGIPLAGPLPWEYRAAQSCQARPEEVQGANTTWGLPAKGGHLNLTMPRGEGLRRMLHTTRVAVREEIAPGNVTVT